MNAKILWFSSTSGSRARTTSTNCSIIPASLSEPVSRTSCQPVLSRMLIMKM